MNNITAVVKGDDLYMIFVAPSAGPKTFGYDQWDKRDTGLLIEIADKPGFRK